MSSPSTPYHRHLLAFIVLAFFTVATVVAALAPAGARGSSVGQLQQQIDSSQGRVSGLSGAVKAAGDKLHALNSNIATLQGHVDKAQADFDAKRAELLKLRTEASAAHTRLLQLQTAERQTQSTLAQQLVSSYEGDNPDIVSVVLNANGFNSLLEQLAFASRISKHNAQVLGQVRASRRAVAAQAANLASLTVRQQKVALQALTERNHVAAAKLALVQQQASVSHSRNAAAKKLAAARAKVASLRSQLNKMVAAQSPSGGSSISVHGKFTFPLSKGDASPPATWSLDDGVDIAAPGGVPEYAVCSGAVVLHGIGGFGPSAPVLHCDSPIGGYSYVYYGHAGPGNWVPVGAHVAQGQVISEIGSGIVGISTGPHLEIGFADSSGSPIGPSSAPAMMSLLQSSY
jgi:murein DD-endopeptidase MepM/ murein hydrolase activator NlpD